MNGFAREVWLSRWTVVRDWLIGALKSLAIIAAWALLIWLTVSLLRSSGVLAQSIQP